MPVDLTKVTFTRDGKDVTGDTLLKAILEQVQVQTAELMTRADGTSAPKNEFEKKYLDTKTQIKEYILENMATSMSVSLLEELLEKGYHVLESKKAVHFESIRNPKSKASEEGGYYGDFVESRFFGMTRDNKPTADIEAINTEIKIHSGVKALQVGRVKVSNISAMDAKDPALKNLVMISKMVSKMQNFLLLKMGKEIAANGEYRMHFKEITLYTVLLIKNLYNMLYKGMLNEGAVQIESAESWNPKTMSKVFNVKLSVGKTFFAYKEVEKITTLYMYREDLLDNIKGDKRFQSLFFNAVKELKLKMLGNNQTVSPSGISVVS